MLMKRSVIEIVNEILQLEGNKKTEIMYKTALTYPQAMRYIKALADRSLLNSTKDERGRDIYHVTERGRELSGHIDVVINLLGLGESLN